MLRKMYSKNAEVVDVKYDKSELWKKQIDIYTVPTLIWPGIIFLIP